MSTTGTILQNNWNYGYQNISPPERSVVDKMEGVLKVITAPETRITEILALRIANILSLRKTLPQNVLCLSATNPSIPTLQNRFYQLIGSDAYRVNILTFDGFCGQVIQANAILFQNDSILPLSTLEGTRLLKKLTDDFPAKHPLKRYRGDVYREINNLQKLFALMKRAGWSSGYLNQKIDAFIAKTSAGSGHLSTLPIAGIEEEKVLLEKLRAGVNEFDHYQNLLQMNNRYDAEDVIGRVINAFENNTKILYQYRQKFQYLQVEEYSVYNHPITKLLQLLMGDHEKPNVLLIGCDEQTGDNGDGTKTNYPWTFDNTDYYKPVTINLAGNPGRTPSAPGVFFNTGEVIAKQMDGNIGVENIVDHRSSGTLLNKPVIRAYKTVNTELAAIIKQVEELLLQNVDPAKIAIVYRHDEYGDALERYFTTKNSSFFSRRKITVLEQPFIKKIIQLLRYISAEQEIPFSGDDLLFEILHFDFYSVPPLEIARLTVEVNSKKYSVTPTAIRKLLRERANAPAKDLFDPGINENLKTVSAFFEKLIADTASSSPWQLFENITRQPLVANYVDQSDDRSWLMQLLAALGDFIKTETTRNPHLQLNEFISLMDIMKREVPPLLTTKIAGTPGDMHIIPVTELQGQVYDYTFVAGANAGIIESGHWFDFIRKLPGIGNALFSFANGENTTRAYHHLLYGMPRGAASNLFISYAKYNGTGQELMPAIFVMEMALRQSLTINNIEWTEDETAAYTSLNKPNQLPEIAHLEEALIRPILNKFVMNVSALNSYLNCPLGFYYKTLLRVPVGKNEAMEFGSAIHYALEKLFKKIPGGQLATGASYAQPAIKNTFAPAAELVEDFNWYMHKHRPQFTSEAFERRLEYGEKVLRNYYDHYVGSWNKVVSVERNIRVIPLNGIPLKGKIDKLEFNGKEVNIVDYKSGDIEKALPKMKAPHDKDPNGGDYWRQAVFYTILVDGYDKKEWRVVSAEFDFIEPDKKNQYRKEKIIVGAPDIATVQHQVTEVWSKIQARKFYTGCGRPDCHWCNFVKDNNLAVALHQQG